MKPSELVAKLLRMNGGKKTIMLLNGDKTRISIGGKDFFVSDKLPNQRIDFSVFDIVADFLKKQPGSKAPKGGCRNSKVGFGQCGRGTVMYTIATEYYGKEEGESSFDPLFVIAAILDWAGIARNCRGYIQLLNH